MKQSELLRWVRGWGRGRSSTHSWFYSESVKPVLNGEIWLTSIECHVCHIKPLAIYTRYGIRENPHKMKYRFLCILGTFRGMSCQEVLDFEECKSVLTL